MNLVERFNNAIISSIAGTNSKDVKEGGAA